jgi:outer membrane protein assembly factor BamB
MLTLLVALLSPPADATTSWTRFRGPNGTGQATGLHWPAEWNQKAILWKMPLPGIGHGSPIIMNGALYLQAAEKNGTQRMVMAVNTSDGKTKWLQTIENQSKAHTHAKNSLASGTATTDGQRVYLCQWDGRGVNLAAYQCADGKPAWSLPLGPHQSQHGAGHSPILHQGNVYVAYDGDNHAEAFCVDAATGKKLWSKDRTVFRASYSTPLIHNGPVGDELVIASTGGITAYDLNNGEKRWEKQWPFANKPLRVVSSPLLCSRHLMLAASGDGGGDRDTIALKLPSSDTTDGRGINLLWQKTRDVPYVTCLLEHDKHLYFVADKGVAGCLDLATGKEKWSHRVGGNFTASPILVDGKVIACSEEGVVTVFQANPEKFDPVGKLKLDEVVYASPAVAEGKLFIRGSSSLFCIGAKP